MSMIKKRRKDNLLEESLLVDFKSLLPQQCCKITSPSNLFKDLDIPQLSFRKVKDLLSFTMEVKMMHFMLKKIWIEQLF
jgi:hypothetical protein